MAEIDPRTGLKIIGVPDIHHTDTAPYIALSIEEEKKKKRGALTEAQLQADELNAFRTIEQAAGAIIKAKMTRLGIPVPSFDPITYAVNPKADFTEGINDPVGVMAIYVNRPVKAFDKFSTIAHAVSHLGVKKQVRQYLSSQDKSAPDRAWATGLEAVGNRKPKASAVEEGMATLDQVDFFNTYLQVNYPEDYRGRRQLAESERIQKQVEKQFSKRLYGEISSVTLAPFVVLETHKLPVIGRKKVVPNLDVVGLKEYLLARKLCEFLGRTLKPNEPIGPDEAFQLGRDELDKDRYLRTQDVHRLLVKAFGGGNIAQGGRLAKWLFSADANDSKGLDEAMKPFRYYVPPRKPLVEVAQPKKPSAYQAWIEATPPTPVSPLEPPQAAKKSVLASQGLALKGDALQAQTDEKPAPAPTPGVEAPPAAPTPSVPEPTISQRAEPDLNSGLRAQLAYATRELEDKLDRIRRIHKGEYIGSAEIEERLADKYRADIERLKAEIAANTAPGS